MRNRIVDLIEAEAAANPDTVFLTGDLGFSVVERIRDRLGERFINAGVAEADMASLAAGLALAGLRAYIYSIAPFVTLRCLEQIRNDICHQGRNVRIVGVGAGYSYGTLGPSHHALEDATIMAALPGMTVLCPAGRAELDALFALYADVDAPIYFRIGRERGTARVPPALSREAPAWIAREGRDATILCAGAVLEKAIEAAEELESEGISLRVVSVPLMHPFPTEAVASLTGAGPVLTLAEAYPDNPLEVGAMRMLMHDPRPFRPISAAQRFPEAVGSHETLRAASGVSARAVVEAVRGLREAGQC